jgi:hypothetical protein
LKLSRGWAGTFGTPSFPRFIIAAELKQLFCACLGCKRSWVQVFPDSGWKLSPR